MNVDSTGRNELIVTKHRRDLAASGGKALPHHASNTGIKQANNTSHINAVTLRQTPALIPVSGEEGLSHLGRITFGNRTIERWEKMGLSLSDAALTTAGKAFQQAFRENLEKNGASLAGSSVVINKHQIVISSQNVPVWFKEEYNHYLSTLDSPEIITAFRNGERFYSSQISPTVAQALSQYVQVEGKI